jgi:hypothetical protein
MHYRPSTPGNALRITPQPPEEQIICVQAIYFDPQEGVLFSLILQPFYLIFANVEQPRIISVRYRKGRPTPVVTTYFPKNETPESIVITQGPSGETLRSPFQLWYSRRSLEQDSPINRAIYNITGGAAKRKWCGPGVVLKFASARRGSYADAELNELPALSAYFLAFI